MFRKIIFILILKFFINHIKCQSVEPRIVGGTETRITDAPYQAAILYDGSLTCGGSIVAPRYIVTAAHCVVGTIAQRYLIRVGSTINSQAGVTAKASNVIYNKDFNTRTLINDIGMIKLIGSLQPFYGASIRPIQLPSASATIPATATISGWGKTKETNPGISAVLKKALIHVFPNQVCSQAYGSTFIASSMLCAGRWDGIKDSCQGDSGGPLESGNVLYGVVSFGDGCGVPGKPGIYTNVPNQRAWIDQIMQRYGA